MENNKTNQIVSPHPMKSKLKIAIIADPELPVPPILYGGIERVIFMLVQGYCTLGHEVSLFAHSDSLTNAKLFPYVGRKSTNKTDVLKNMLLINRELYKNQYDIVHNFGRLVYLFPQLPFKLPKLMSYQREPTVSSITGAMRYAKQNSLAFTGCSEYISQQITPYAPSSAIFNGVDLDFYHFQEKVDQDAPLVFLGRIEPIKGTHTAIEVAIQTEKKLIIAGNVPEEHQHYFDEAIKPRLNEQVKYIGAVNDAKKNDLLGSALAFLMPIEWNEPFGIVMAEALACGTPVIGFNRGSVAEIVINGRNGFKCDDVNEMIKYVKKIGEVSRYEVRKDAEKRFSAEVIIQEYLSLYSNLINKHG
ncbi:glycosyltransferase involved in cell wall biosynthesis [Pedobacter sp. W3I1]|uniref:glycosyltransferase family 4 protein n=1 Tax=Pedobacter sp. W3I1 TaxID=3042291 RepID=UPI0027853BC8|nr:glycosyltransferase family 4 protein [Pedobacter sp. W3I1]MDQ0640912.1 glycosyltransferase involved in cell wall biosynthesis [Pedobacter sp. W3I1]